MSKAILEFDLEEEREEFLDAIHGSAWKSAVRELDELMRRTQKHSDDDCIRNEAVNWRNQLHEQIEEAGLSLD